METPPSDSRIEFPLECLVSSNLGMYFPASGKKKVHMNVIVESPSTTKRGVGYSAIATKGIADIASGPKKRMMMLFAEPRFLGGIRSSKITYETL